jgi:hypothetical protein
LFNCTPPLPHQLPTAHNCLRSFKIAVAILPAAAFFPTLAWIFPFILLVKPRARDLLFESWKKACSSECNSFLLWWQIITINVPLILKTRDINFLRANYFMGHFKGYFEGVKKVEAPSKYPNKWPKK